MRFAAVVGVDEERDYDVNVFVVLFEERTVLLRCGLESLSALLHRHGDVSF